MGDQTITLYHDDKDGVKMISKLIGGKELFFNYNDETKKAVFLHTTNHEKDRMYSPDDLRVPKHQFSAAVRQVTAIFKNLKTPKAQPTISEHQTVFPFFK